MGRLRNLPYFPIGLPALRAKAPSCSSPCPAPMSRLHSQLLHALAAPTPAAPVPPNATSSAAGSLISGEEPSSEVAQLIPPAPVPEGQFGTHLGGGLLQEPAPSVPVPRSTGGGGLAWGGSAALQLCPSPAGLPFGTLLPAGLRKQLLPQGRCPFPLHLGQHPLCPRSTPCLEGPAAQDVHERAQRCAGVSHGTTLTGHSPQPPRGFWDQ